jgi:DegV family protein with EDD domain
MIARQFGSRVQVLDSMSVNAGMGYVLEEARRRLAEGVSWEGLEAAITPYRARVRGLVLPATLEYLKRSGRVSGLRFLLGSLLKVLPILEFKDGLAQPVERVRGFHRGLTELAQRFRAAFPSGARVTLAHVENPQAVKELSDLLKSEGVVLEGVRHVGAGVTVHAGPGAVALFAAPLKTAA